MHKQQRWYDTQPTTLRCGFRGNQTDNSYPAANVYADGSPLLIGTSDAASPVYHMPNLLPGWLPKTAWREPP